MFFFVACQTSEPSEDGVQKSISTVLIDSLGERAYSDYAAYQHDPDQFLEPLKGKLLSPAQRDTYVWILINMAYGFQEHSHILRSTEFYEKAYLYDQQNQILTKEDRLEFLYKPLANNYTILSDYQKAERLILSALSEAEAPHVSASFYNNLSLMYTSKQDYEKSKSSALEGLNLLANLLDEKDAVYESILLNNSLSNVYLATNQLDSAALYNKQALFLSSDPVYIQNNVDLWAGAKVAALELSAKLYNQDGQYDQATQALRSALKLEILHFPKSRFREKARLHNQLGWIEILKKNYVKAKESLLVAKSYQLTASLDRSVSSSYTGIEIYRNLGYVYARLGLDSARTYFRKTVEADFSYQQSVTSKKSHLQGNYFNRELLDMVITEILRLNPDPDQETLMELLWMTELTKGRLLWNSIHRSKRWAKDSDLQRSGMEELQSLYRTRDQLENDVDLKDIDQKISTLQAKFELEEQYFEHKNLVPDFEGFKSSVRTSDALQYSYFIHSDQLFTVFIIDQGTISLVQQHKTALSQSIREIKDTYFSSSPHAYNQDPGTYQDLAKVLASMVLPNFPVSKSDEKLDFNKHRKLKLSLDNELFMLPFDALMVESRSGVSSFLIEHYQIQYVNSLLIGSLYTQKEFSNSPIHILFREKYDPPYVNLPFVKEEVQSLSRNFKSNLYDSHKLTASQFSEAFTSEGIIHIAAHAVIDSTEMAKLLLNQPISTDQIFYSQVNTPLVVLSACNTASGKLLLSEGLESINRAFLSKGVPGVVATHWFANDDAMLDLTARFYDQLRACKNPVQALAQAKRSFLTEQSEAGKNPWYWANMAYTGEETTIDLPTRTGLSFQSAWIYGTLFTLSICAIGFVRFRNRKNQSTR